MPDDKYRIFFSHKLRNGEIVKELKREFEELGNDRLEVSISEDFVPGEEWVGQIEEGLTNCQMLLLLYTDPAQGWEWCLYEAGFFRRRVQANTDPDKRLRLIYLHPKDSERPDQLKHLQSTPAIKESVRKVLDIVYVDEKLYKDPERRDFSLNTKRNEKLDKDLDALAARIVQLVNNAPIEGVREPYCKSLTLVIDNSDSDLPDAAIPPGTKVIAEPETLQLFGLRGRNCTWKDLLANAECDRQWVSELSVNVHLARNHKVFRPGDGNIRAKNDVRTYRPHLVDGRLLDGAFHCTVLLTEEATFLDDNVKLPIPNFKRLMGELIELIQDADEDGVELLCLTPALGFLARPQEEWNRLFRCFKDNKSKISITCLDTVDLEEWHGKFIDRQTDRGGPVTAADVRNANEISEELIDMFPRKKRLEWDALPDYYAFGDNRRAIIVTPLGLPRLDSQPSPDLPKVEMFGLVTNNAEIVRQVTRVHTYYATRPPRTKTANA